MAKTPEWHEQLAAILERRARLTSEIKRARTLSAETRKMALQAVEDECFAAAQRVFPRPTPYTVLGSGTSVTAIPQQHVQWGTGAS